MDKRIEPRICTAFTAKCVHPQNNIFYSAIKNISTTGIQILCDKKLSPGEELTIFINMIHDSAEVKAEVAWFEQFKCAERYCAGLRFVDVNTKNKKKLDNFIDSIYMSTIYCIYDL